MLKKVSALIAILFLISQPSGAEEAGRKAKKSGFLFGVGFSYSSAIYKGSGPEFMPIPVIGYKSEKLNIFGPFISYNVLSFSDFSTSVKAGPRFDGFDESDGIIFSGMAERKMSAEAGLSFSYNGENLEADISMMHDILNRSNGYEIAAEFGKVFSNGPFFIKPSAGFSFLDRRHVNYYYGVRIAEVSPDREFFKGKSAINPTIGISLATPILLDGFTRIAYKHRWYDSNITRSPLVGKTSGHEVLCTYSRFF